MAIQSLPHAPAAIALRAPSANCFTIRVISCWPSSRGTGYAAAWPDGVYTRAARGRGMIGPPTAFWTVREKLMLAKACCCFMKHSNMEQRHSNDTGRRRACQSGPIAMADGAGGGALRAAERAQSRQVRSSPGGVTGAPLLSQQLAQTDGVQGLQSTLVNASLLSETKRYCP